MTRGLPSIALRWLLPLCLAVMTALGVIDAPLKTPRAPHGIVSFELCAFSGTCEEILREWTPTHREYAMLSLGVDYLYLALYPAVITSGLLLLSGRLSGNLPRLTKGLAWLVAGVGIADAIENFCLIRLLTTGQVEVFALPAAMFASAKFAVVAIALLWLAIGFAATWRTHSDA